MSRGIILKCQVEYRDHKYIDSSVKILHDVSMNNEGTNFIPRYYNNLYISELLEKVMLERELTVIVTQNQQAQV